MYSMLNQFACGYVFLKLISFYQGGSNKYIHAWLVHVQIYLNGSFIHIF